MPAEFGEPLSEREREIVVLVAQGLANKEIGARLFLSPNTVKVHLRNIFTKTGAASRTELTMIAVRAGWVTVTAEGQEPAPELEAEAEWEPRPTVTGLPAELPAGPLTEAGADVTVWPPAEPLAAAVPPWPWYRWVALVFGLLLALGVFVLPRRAVGNLSPGPAVGALVDQPGNDGMTGAPETGSRWQELAALPVRRSRLGLALWRGKLFAVGGLTAEGPTDRLDIYDPTTDSWTTGASHPLALANLGAVAMENGILVPGGCDAQGRPSSTVHLYQPLQDTWKEVAPLPQPLCGYALAVWKGRAYLLGGWDGQQYRALAYRYDLQTNRWDELRAPQEAREFGAAAALGDRLFYVGGYNGRGELDVCEWYAPADDQWGHCSSLLLPRGGLGLAAIGGNLYAIGGGWTTYLGFNERYSLQNDQWSVVETPLVGEWRNLGLVASDTSLYAVGGWSDDYLNRVYTLEVLPYRVFIPVTLP